MKDAYSIAVKIARVKSRKTQKQVCKIAKISPNTLVKAEKGDFSGLTYSSMQRLAAALETDVQTLFFSDEQ